MSDQTAESDASANDRLSGFREGCLFWIGFTIVAVLIRGVRWDENYEFAQVMTGLVPLDDAHPLRQYTLAAYNLQFYSSALIVLINDHPVFLCGFRNILFILATVLPPYMLGTWVSRNAWIGHAAAVFVLLGIHLEFDGVYPQFVWPGMFSNGHVGVGYVLVFAGCLAAGHMRSAGLLLGLMPAIHLGQLPPALVLAGLFAIRCVYRKDWPPLLGAIRYFAMGIVICVLFYAIQQQFALTVAMEGPYFSDADPRTIWQGRIASHDMHRQIPYGNVHIITVATLLIGWLGWRRLRREDSALTAAWFWMTVYATCVIATTYIIIAIHAALGPDIPYLLLGWLPYRLLNHLPPILIVLALTVLTRLGERDDSRAGLAYLFIVATIAFVVLKPLLGVAVGSELYTRYLFHNDILLFALLGAAACLLSMRDMKAFAMFVCAWIGLALVHHYGAAITLASGLLTFVALRNGVTFEFEVDATLKGALAVIALAAILWPEFQNRAHLPVGAFEREVSEILEVRGDGDALLLAHPQQVLLQAQTGHPVFTDMATEFHASYRPSLGPSVQAMYEDVYGIWFERREVPPPGWRSTWSARTPEEWAAIESRWDIEYVIVPNDVPMQLAPLLQSELDTLYALPE